MSMHGKIRPLEPLRAPISPFVDHRPISQILSRFVGDRSAGRMDEFRQERLVARQLKRLSEPWTVVNDLSLRALDNHVDHLVVGPAGIFCLSTHDHRGKSVRVTEDSIRVNNFPVGHLSKARASARAVRRDLGHALGRDIYVQSVVVVITNDLAIRTQVLGGSVVEARRVCDWLERKRPVMDAQEVSRIASLIHQPSTWTAESPGLSFS